MLKCDATATNIGGFGKGSAESGVYVIFVLGLGLDLQLIEAIVPSGFLGHSQLMANFKIQALLTLYVLSCKTRVVALLIESCSAVYKISERPPS